MFPAVFSRLLARYLPRVLFTWHCIDHVWWVSFIWLLLSYRIPKDQQAFPLDLRRATSENESRFRHTGVREQHRLASTLRLFLWASVLSFPRNAAIPALWRCNVGLVIRARGNDGRRLVWKQNRAGMGQSYQSGVSIHETNRSTFPSDPWCDSLFFHQLLHAWK